MIYPFRRYSTFIGSELAALSFDPTIDGWVAAREKLEELGFELKKDVAEQVPQLREPYVGPEGKLLISPTMLPGTVPSLHTVMRKTGNDPKPYLNALTHREDLGTIDEESAAFSSEATLMIAFSKTPFPFTDTEK